MHVQFAELPVFDQDRAIAFYTDRFDCRVAVDAPTGDGEWRWIELEFAGAESTLHFVRREDDSPSPGPVLVLVDDDVEGIIEALRSDGVEIVTEPKEAPWQPGRTVASFRDSEGNEMVIGAG